MARSSRPPLKTSPRARSALRASANPAPPASPDPRLLALILALALVGTGLSIALTYIHYWIRHEPAWHSACAISETVNCDAVLRSPYATFAGVPLSWIGVWFYAALGALAALDLGGNPLRFPRSPALVLLAASSFAVVLSAVLALTSALDLKTFCILCGALYAVNLGLWVLSAGARRSTGEHLAPALAAEWRSWKQRPVPPIVAGAAALAVLLVTGTLYASSAETSLICQAAVEAARSTARTPLELLIYADFQCPACRTLDRALRPLRPAPALRLRRAHFPLDTTCNSHLRRTLHPGACDQAIAALCAEQQAQGERYSEKLFDEEATRPEDLVALARSLGLDAPQFEACLASGSVRAALSEEIDSAARAGVKATPTTSTQDQLQVGLWTPEDLRCVQAIAAAHVPSAR